jgi:hypothetical protein
VSYWKACFVTFQKSNICPNKKLGTSELFKKNNLDFKLIFSWFQQISTLEPNFTTKFQKFCAEFFTIESATNIVSKMPLFIKIHPRRPEISSILYQKTCQDDWNSFIFLFNIIFSQSYAFSDTKLKISSVSVDEFWWMIAFWKRFELHFP